MIVMYLTEICGYGAAAVQERYFMISCTIHGVYLPLSADSRVLAFLHFFHVRYIERDTCLCARKGELCMDGYSMSREWEKVVFLRACVRAA